VEAIMMTINDMMSKIHEDNVERGWWDGFKFPLDVQSQKDRSVVIEKLCLVHSELSEALEDVRHGHPLGGVHYEITKPCGFPTEIADAIIRLLDLAAVCGIDMETVILEKLAYNRTRGHRYGGKLA
jgi:NTP pyrophosphatase (non-canonical NTP hydrolase)